jgi:Rod binding domain-containing protein
MSDFAIQPVMGVGAGYDAQSLSALAGMGSTSYLEAMNLGHIEGDASRRPDVDRMLVEFQGFLVQEMLKTMRAAVPASDLFGENPGREIFESLLDGEYARSIGEKTGGLGLTETLKTQLGIVDAPEGLPALPITGRDR